MNTKEEFEEFIRRRYKSRDIIKSVHNGTKCIISENYSLEFKYDGGNNIEWILIDSNINPCTVYYKKSFAKKLSKRIIIFIGV